MGSQVRDLRHSYRLCYAVNCLTSWVYRWIEDQWFNSRGYPVANADIIGEAHAAISRLENMGYDVEFWKIPRGENGQADNLANEALDDMEY